ncbi:MAG: response regulator [Coriobacteriales bacterium]|jgi:PAS domain S-box-containing protein|nr:response regulator [Coriobacteriales bacterium]
MRWFADIKIRHKMYLAMGILVVIMVMLVAGATVQLNGVNQNVKLIRSYQERQVHVSEATAEFYKLRVTYLSMGYLMSSAEYAEVAPALLYDHDMVVASFRENLAKFRELVVADARIDETAKKIRLELADQIEADFSRYLDTFAPLSQAVASGDRQEVFDIYIVGTPIGTTVNEELLELSSIINTALSQDVSSILVELDNTGMLMLVIAALFIVVALIMTLTITRSIAKPVMQLEEAVVEITNGNLTYPIRSNRKDELGSLSDCISNMVDNISEHNKLTAIMDTMDSIIIVCDLDYNLLFINKHTADTFGLNRDEIANQKCYKFTRHRDTPCEYCLMGSLLEEKESLPFREFKYVWDDCLNAWCDGTSSIIRWVDGSLVFIQSLRDVSAKKEQERLLEEALETAKAASEAKTTFLATMSHEIRTPMNAILGVSEIQLQDPSLKSGVREAISLIYNSGELLLNIINDLLDMSKIDAGKFELIPTKYDTASLINDTMMLNMARLGSRPIEFKLFADENIPSALIGDELRIKQIMSNLLSNAFKYTKKGTIELHVSVDDEPVRLRALEGESSDEAAEEALIGAAEDTLEANEAAGPGASREATPTVAESETTSDVTLVIKVIDTGVGMSAEQIERIFDEYSRFNTRADRATQGTGLGMSIVKRLLNKMGGEISVTSVEDKGSKFTVRIPQQRIGTAVLGKELVKNLQMFRVHSVKQIRNAQILIEPMPYGRVLIVDDVESNLYVAKGLLRPYKLKIDTAKSGYDAIVKVKDGNVYDILFMDHMMPGMDGVAATKIIRELGYQHPIVALTANSVIGQSEVFLANGFDGFVAKPIDLRELNAVLKKFVRKEKPPESEEAPVEQDDSGSGALDLADAYYGELKSLTISPEFAEIFVRDATRALGVLTALIEGKTAFTDEDLQSFIVTVHGMKSTFANIGEDEYSAFARRLEQAGREGDLPLITAETPAFIDSLQLIIERLTSVEVGSIDLATDEDFPYLRERLRVVQEACAAFDTRTAKEIVSELRQKGWPCKTKEKLREISELLLHSDFDEVTVVAEELISQLEA